MAIGANYWRLGLAALALSFASPGLAQDVPVPMPDAALRVSWAQFFYQSIDALNGEIPASKWNAYRVKGPPPTPADLRQACGIGAPAAATSSEAFTYAGRGPTPSTVNGATTVSPVAVKCLIDRFGDRILVADAAGEGALPESLDISFAGRPMTGDGKTLDEIQQQLKQALFYATVPNNATPIVVYCHNDNCALSYYAAIRIVDLGYTNVLWMRSGMDGWKSAGFSFASAPARWIREPLEQVAAWQQCISKQKAPDTGTDPAQLAESPIRACRAQENSLYESMGPWIPSQVADGTIRSLRSSVVGNMQHLAEQRAEDAKEQAELAENEARWQRIEAAIASAGSEGAFDGFEWCLAQPFDGEHRSTTYFSSVYRARLPRVDPLTLTEYMRLDQEAQSGRGNRFGLYVNQMNREDVPLIKSCFVSETQADAVKQKAQYLAGLKDVQDTIWKP